MSSVFCGVRKWKNIKFMYSYLTVKWQRNSHNKNILSTLSWNVPDDVRNASSDNSYKEIFGDELAFYEKIFMLVCVPESRNFFCHCTFLKHNPPLLSLYVYGIEITSHGKICTFINAVGSKSVRTTALPRISWNSKSTKDITSYMFDALLDVSNIHIMATRHCRKLLQNGLRLLKPYAFLEPIITQIEAEKPWLTCSASLLLHVVTVEVKVSDVMVTYFVRSALAQQVYQMNATYGCRCGRWVWVSMMFDHH